MSKTIAAIALAALVAVPGCMRDTQDDKVATGALTGAVLGVVTAKVLDADDDWVLLAGLTGAAIGAMVARNDARNECAYANGDGTYTVRRCP